MADCSAISDRIAALQAAIPKLQGYIAKLTALQPNLTAEQRTQLAAYQNRLSDYQSELSSQVRALAACRALPVPAPTPPPQAGSCRIDLLSATSSQMGAYCSCQGFLGGSSQWISCVSQLQQQKRLLTDVGNAIDAVLPGVQGVVGDVTGAISGELGGIVAEIGEFLAGLRAAFAQIDLDAAKAAADPLGQIVNGIIDGLNGLVGGAGDAIVSANDAVSDSIGRLLVHGQNTFLDIAGEVAGGVGDLVGDAAGAVGAVVDAAVGGISDVVGTAVDVVSFLGGGIVDAVADSLRIANDVLGDTGDAVGFLVGGLVDSLALTVGTLADALGDIPGALDTLVNEVIPGAIEALSGLPEDLAAFLADPVKGIIGGFLHGEEPDIIATVNAVYARIERNPELPPEVRAIIGGARATDRPLPALIGLMVLPIALSTVIGAVLNPVAQLVIQEENIVLRPTRLSLGDAVAAEQRELASSGYTAEIGARAGYPDGDIALARLLGVQQPTPTDLLELTRRKIIPDGALVGRLRRLGYDPADAAALAELREVIPPLSDLVRFAVREAFPGQSGYGGGRGSGVPGGFTDAAAKIGLSPEFARSYWAAHWELPGVGQVFEMYQRGIIDLGTLNAYLVEADVAPEWRDRLTAISFNPLTRVDVRRMYATGVLTFGELQQAYQDVGYSPANARRLADFTRALTDDADDDTAAVERDLTRSDLIGAYRDGILDRGRLLASLSDLGYDPAEAELLAARADLAEGLERRKAVKTAVIAAGRSGAIGIPEVEAQLAAAGFTAAEITVVVSTIGDARAVKTAFPSKADLFAFSKAKLINEAELTAALSDLGFGEPWLSRYVSLARAKLLPTETA